MTHVSSGVQRPEHVKSHSCSGESGTALALLVKCLQNLCAVDPAARKQVLCTNQYVVKSTEHLSTDA
jgi:hypothetical protein